MAKKTSKTSKDSLSGQTFLFTGKLIEFTRAEAEKMVKSSGGLILSGVTEKLNYLIVGRDAGSKLDKANKIKSVRVLKEKEFLKLVTSVISSSAKKEQPEKKPTSSKKSAVSKVKKLDKRSARIGKQVWMVENLNVDHFRNGDLIPEARTDKEWKQAAKEGKPAWCYYENDTSYGKKYGKLYNWFAVCDPRGLAPEGWHVPSDNEWLALTGGAAGEGGYLLEFGDWDWKTGEKMKSTYGWNRYCRRKDGEMESGNGTNNSGFCGLPGGCRQSDGTFFFIGDSGNWWSSTKGKTIESAWSRTLLSSSETVERDYNDKGKGFSIRCIKD